MLTKPSVEPTILDTLSRLTFARVTKLLGAERDRLIAAGGKHDVDITTQVEFDRDRFRVAVDFRGISTRPAYQRQMAFRHTGTSIIR